MDQLIPSLANLLEPLANGRETRLSVKGFGNGDLGLAPRRDSGRGGSERPASVHRSPVHRRITQAAAGTGCWQPWPIGSAASALRPLSDGKIAAARRAVRGT
jgi:hypothetical protein